MSANPCGDLNIHIFFLKNGVIFKKAIVEKIENLP
jgi:hypothetical protein